MPEVPFRYDPIHTALIVIDVQNDFCSQAGSLARQGFDVTAAQEIIPRLRELVIVSRRVGLAVFFVRTLHDQSTDSPQWLGRVGDGPGTERTGLTCRTGTWGSDFFEIQPEPGEPVVIKNRFSAFVGTNLDLLLRTRGIRSLLFSGVTTETCVESTLRDGLFREYYVSLIEDCAASYNQEAHAASANIVANNFGTVIRSSELLQFWQEEHATAAR